MWEWERKEIGVPLHFYFVLIPRWVVELFVKKGKTSVEGAK